MDLFRSPHAKIARSPQFSRKIRPYGKFLREHDVNFGCGSVNVYRHLGCPRGCCPGDVRAQNLGHAFSKRKVDSTSILRDSSSGDPVVGVFFENSYMEFDR